MLNNIVLRVVRLVPDKLATAIKIKSERLRNDGSFLIVLVINLLKHYQDLVQQAAEVSQAAKVSLAAEVSQAVEVSRAAEAAKVSRDAEGATNLPSDNQVQC